MKGRKARATQKAFESNEFKVLYNFQLCELGPLMLGKHTQIMCRKCQETRENKYFVFYYKGN